jgi:hypothetical protein
MFGTYFRYSLKALLLLVILPIIIFLGYIFVLYPYVIEGYVISGEDFEWIHVVISMVCSIVVNFIFLMIIPAATSPDPVVKRVQFYLGFFVNLVAAVVLSIFYFIYLEMDEGFLAIALALHILGFVLPFIFGALCVAPGYVNDFWFVNRSKNK